MARKNWAWLLNGGSVSSRFSTPARIFSALVAFQLPVRSHSEYESTLREGSRLSVTGS